MVFFERERGWAVVLQGNYHMCAELSSLDGDIFVFEELYEGFVEWLGDLWTGGVEEVWASSLVATAVEGELRDDEELEFCVDD